MSNMMPMGGGLEDDWRSDAFRQSMIRKLEEAIKVKGSLLFFSLLNLYDETIRHLSGPW